MPGKHSFRYTAVGRSMSYLADRWGVLKRRGDSVGISLRIGATALVIVLAAAVIVWSMVWLRSVSPKGPGPLLVEPVFPPEATPTVVETIPVLPAPTITALSPSPSSSPSRSRGPSVRPGDRRSAPGVPQKTTTKPAPPPAVIASYAAGSSWDTGFIGTVLLQNTGTTPVTWTVTLRFDDSDGVRIGQTWNADVDRRGGTTAFRGGPLAPGATQSFGFEATKRTRDRVWPSSCTVNGMACRVR